MPDYFPQALSFQDTFTFVAGDSVDHVRLPFPIVQADTTKRLIQEILAWELDLSELNHHTVTSLLIAASLTLNAQADSAVQTLSTNQATSQTLGDVNVIDRFQTFKTDAEFGSPIYVSLVRGGLGMIIPQEFIWFNLAITSDSAATDVKVGLRVWYRQRSVPNRDELLGLLASRTQLDITSG